MEFEEIKSEVQRVRLIKLGVTLTILVIMVISTIIFWDASTIYVIELEANKEEGYQWIYTFSEEKIVAEKSQSYENGIYSFEFQGINRGKTEINFFCIKDGDSENVAEVLDYSVRVDKSLNIVNKLRLNK